MNLRSKLANLAILCLFAFGIRGTALGQDFIQYQPAFLRGIVEGCMDGQKRSLEKQGIPYKGNEELTRQYCHCLLPVSADVSSTAEGRNALLDGNPKIVARVRKAEGICLDGLKNGRRFAPEMKPGKTEFDSRLKSTESDNKCLLVLLMTMVNDPRYRPCKEEQDQIDRQSKLEWDQTFDALVKSADEERKRRK